ncbi:tectonin domain-containing protein, partial [Streptomyces decoyicus]|uniref:tectonin domain-containing protein n=1 Tax=Streptomyces decoyicus TaxID=249567 RepID=UPI00363760A8
MISAFSPYIRPFGCLCRAASSLCTVRGKGDANMADWKQISGGLTTISVGSRTHVWGVNSLGQMYRYTGHDSNPWVGIPGKAVDIG